MLPRGSYHRLQGRHDSIQDKPAPLLVLQGCSSLQCNGSHIIKYTTETAALEAFQYKPSEA